MTSGSLVMRFSYGTDGRPLALEYNEVSYYYITNLQGDVVAIVNSSGTTVVKYTYDAWGRLISTDDDTNINLGEINPLRYRGYIYDQETGLYYLQSRYYNPTWGRFLNADAFVSTGKSTGLSPDGGALTKPFENSNIFSFCRKRAGIPMHFLAKLCLRKERCFLRKVSLSKKAKRRERKMSNNNNNQINIPQAREAMDKFKMQAAQEVGVNLTNGYNGHLTSREAGSVGGQMVKKMVEAYEQGLQ